MTSQGNLGQRGKAALPETCSVLRARSTWFQRLALATGICACVWFVVCVTWVAGTRQGIAADTAPPPPLRPPLSVVYGAQQFLASVPVVSAEYALVAVIALLWSRRCDVRKQHWLTNSTIVLALCSVCDAAAYGILVLCRDTIDSTAMTALAQSAGNGVMLSGFSYEGYESTFGVWLGYALTYVPTVMLSLVAYRARRSS